MSRKAGMTYRMRKEGTKLVDVEAFASDLFVIPGWSLGTATTTPPATTTPEPVALYLCDNGRCVCEAHLGATAKRSGRDVSGRLVHRVNRADVTYAVEIGCALECEVCGVTL